MVADTLLAHRRLADAEPEAGEVAAVCRCHWQGPRRPAGPVGDSDRAGDHEAHLALEIATPQLAEDSDPAEILAWLDALVPPWPLGQTVAMAGQLWRGPAYGGTAVDFEVHPDPSSRTVPVGALVDGIRAALAAGGEPVALRQAMAVAGAHLPTLGSCDPDLELRVHVTVDRYLVAARPEQDPDLAPYAVAVVYRDNPGWPRQAGRRWAVRHSRRYLGADAVWSLPAGDGDTAWWDRHLYPLDVAIDHAKHACLRLVTS